jgi:RNA polymerase sigma-70 factor (ECF subfamily)
MGRSVSDAHDIELITRFRNGDQSAFEEIVLESQDRIYNLCRRMLGNAHDAEDAAQDVFLKAYQALARFEPGASLSTWLYRIAINTCIDYKRKPFFESLFKRSDEGEEIMIDMPSGEPSPERLAESKQMRQSLQKSLGKLSQKLRTAIILKEIEGLSYEEIAEVLDISMGTVKSRIARAREELIELLGETDY